MYILPVFCFFSLFAISGHSPCFIYWINGGRINIEFDYCFDIGSFSYRLNNGVHFFVEVLCQDGRIYFTITLRRFGDDFSVFFTCFECLGFGHCMNYVVDVILLTAW